MYESEGVGKARTQKVDIYFNYVGQVDIAYTEEELAEIKTAVSEAVTNCIVHGYEENPKGIITLECKISYDRKLYIKVADKGRGIENIEQARRPLFTTGDFEERSGMGFTVMESFMDSIEVVSQPGEGTEVVMTKSLAYSVGR